MPAGVAAADDGPMTTTVTPRDIAAALRRVWTDGRRVARIAYVIGALLFTSGAVHVGVLIATGGSWSGPLSLRKPATFGLSFGLTLATVAWASSFVTIRPRTRTALLGVFAGASVVETALVSMQAWRGVPSHFNFQTEFDNTVSMTLAAGGGVIIVTVLAFTAAAVYRTAAVSPSMRLALRFGFLSLLLALGIGAVMIANGVSLARSGDPVAAYTTAGALKPLHGVAMHAILALPALAWSLRFTGWPERRRVRSIRIAAAGYTALIAAAAFVSWSG